MHVSELVAPRAVEYVPEGHDSQSEADEPPNAEYLTVPYRTLQISLTVRCSTQSVATDCACHSSPPVATTMAAYALSRAALARRHSRTPPAPLTATVAVPSQRAQSEPSPGADGAGVGPVPAQMGQA